MRRHTSRYATLGPAMGLLVAAACSQVGPQAPAPTPPLPPALRPGSVVVVNDPATLEQRIQRTSRPLAIEPSASRLPALRSEAVKGVPVGATLQLVGEVQSPVVDGRTVQANDVDVRDHLAAVAYNFAGEVFVGAIQVIDFRQPRHPVVVSEVQFRNADVDAVALQGGFIYVGLAADDPTLDTPAVVQEFAFTTSGGLQPTGEWADLPSWSVTDLAVQGDWVVATVGAQDGGIAVVRRTDALREVSFTSATDVRGVAVDAAGIVSVSGGLGALARHTLPGLLPQSVTPIEGYRTLAAKGTIEAYANRAYLGAGEGGMQVRAADGALLAALQSEAWGGVDPTTAVVNAVTVTSHLAFVAAGGQGVQVVELGRYRADDDGTHAGDPGLQLLGRLGLEPGASCNMVKAKDDVLVVAAGRGGVKLVEMTFQQ